MATPDGGSPHAASDLLPPSYPEMIVAAIAALAEENGSSQAAIARRIEAEARGGDLPASHPALVAAHLARMSAAGELVAVAGGKYALPPPPPPAPPAAPGSLAAEDDDGGFLEDDDEEEEEDVPEPDPVPPLPAKRGRGRPPKARPPGFVAGGGHAPGAAAIPAAAPRRRGRPPKPRDPHAPPKVPRPRGRPRKNPLPEGMAPRPPAAKPRPQFAEVGFV
ncbi:hypothetical protein ACP4OV_001765 [Aristida adscensionis]